MPMTLRLTPEETEALRETARREQRSMQDVARTAIDEYVTRRARRRDDRSSLAAATLRDLGFSRATDLVGGFNGWVSEGPPVEPAQR